MKPFLVKCAGVLGLAGVYLLASLPHRLRLFLGDMIGLLWFDVLRIRRRVAIANVQIAFPKLSLREQTNIARWSLRHMGRTIIEFSLFPFFRSEDVAKNFEIQGIEYLEQAFAQNRGVLFLSLHVGNGDFGVAALSRMGWSMSLISKVFKSKWLNDLWFEMRVKHGTQFISPEKSSFQILRALKAKRGVFFVLDQFMGPPVGCRTTFFGKETGTAMGLAIMAQRSGSPVVPSYTYRKKDGRHVIVFEPEIVWQDATPTRLHELSRQEEGIDQNIASMTQVYTDKIEQIVRRHPEQWMWIHRRWKNFG